MTAPPHEGNTPPVPAGRAAADPKLQGVGPQLHRAGTVTMSLLQAGGCMFVSATSPLEFRETTVFHSARDGEKELLEPEPCTLLG